MSTKSLAIATLAGRALLSSLFLVSGFGKLAAPAATMAYIASSDMPAPSLGYLAAVVIEVGFGLALLAGYRTRPVAVVMAIFTLATALIFHSNLADPMQLINFLKNLAIIGGLLQAAAFGAGALSLDALRQRAPVRPSLAASR